jgi:hypothetical protein
MREPVVTASVVSLALMANKTSYVLCDKPAEICNAAKFWSLHRRIVFWVHICTATRKIGPHREQ